MKKILHIIHNDKKFINIIVKQFSREKELINTFILLSNKKENINSLTHQLIIKSPKELLHKKFLEGLNQYDIIFIHFLGFYQAKMLSLANNINATIIWGAWGGDFYNHHPLLKKSLLEKKTKYFEYFTFQLLLRKIIHPIINLIYPKYFLYYWQKKAIIKINYIAPIIYEDYELIKKYYNAPFLKYLPFSYGTLEEDLINGINDNIYFGNNILLGNSATLTNNHIEIIDILSNLNLNNRSIITPLNYGNDKYKKHIINYGYKKLGTKFYPLVQFLPIEEYQKLLTTCGFAIMNHKRQQGVGNIFIMLYIGAKIFLNSQNPLYNYFRRIGAYIYTIDDIISQKEKAFSPLKIEEIQKNKEVVFKNINKKVVEEHIKHICNL